MIDLEPSPTAISDHPGAALSIRSTTKVKYSQWLPLWNGIHAHHHSEPIADDVSRRTFQRQIQGDPRDGALRGLVAFLDKKPVGFAHFFLHQSSYQNHPVCELEDLFVIEAARGKGVGRALFDEVVKRAKVWEATEMRWVTAPTNLAAIALYNKVGQEENVKLFRAFF